LNEEKISGHYKINESVSGFEVWANGYRLFVPVQFLLPWLAPGSCREDYDQKCFYQKIKTHIFAVLIKKGWIGSSPDSYRDG